MLLQSGFNYREQGIETMLWTAGIDIDHAYHITSRIGLDAAVLGVGPDTGMEPAVEAQHGVTPIACVMVDEAQFSCLRPSAATCASVRSTRHSRALPRPANRRIVRRERGPAGSCRYTGRNKDALPPRTRVDDAFARG